MRMICLLLVVFLASCSVQAGRRNEKSLRFAAGKLARALEQRDTATLNLLLANNVEYGHSNGWIETKGELKAHLFNGKLVYNSIKLTGQEPRCKIEGRKDRIDPGRCDDRRITR